MTERSKSDVAEKVHRVVDPALRRGHSPPCRSKSAEVSVNTDVLAPRRGYQGNAS